MSRRRYRGEGSFSKNGYGGTAQDEVGRTIYNRVEQLLQSRWRLLCPFPFERPEHDLWMFALTPDQRVAWNTLAKSAYFEKAIHRVPHFDIANDEQGYNIRVYLNTTLPKWPLDYRNLPDALWEQVHRWQVMSRSYRDEYTTIRDHVRDLVRVCATPGQIERVWPELMGFMPDETKHARFDKKARSPYPEGVMQYNQDTCLYEPQPKWRRETLQWYDDAIAESLVLPLYEHPAGAPQLPDILEKQAT